MITADQLVAHAVGDYLLQSQWMANNKTKSTWAAFVHACTYTIPFLVFSPSPAAIGVILWSHVLIDRFRLARYLVWFKNAALHPTALHPILFGIDSDEEMEECAKLAWVNCKSTGYPGDVPPWMSTWLMIIADNIIHVLINGAALRWL